MEMFYKPEYYHTLKPDSFQDRLQARRAQRKAEPADAPAGGNSSAVPTNRQASMAETFPDYPIEHWVYLPSLRGADGWITIRACAILRHDQRRARHGFSFNRLSPTMRMKWKHFVDDLEAELSPSSYFRWFRTRG